MTMTEARTLAEKPAISREEAIALGVAVWAHAVLIAVLALHPLGKEPAPPPARMTVTFAEETADRSTSPNPFEQAAPDQGPVLGEVPPEPVPNLVPEPNSVVQPRPAPPQPSRMGQQVTQPPPKAQPQRQATPPRDERQRRRPDGPAGASRVGNDFLNGVPTGTRPGAQGNPAEAVSDTAKASARQTIAAEVVPYWNRCPVDGVDIEKLQVRIVIHMDRSGRVLSMDTADVTGRTAANAPQVGRFIECAQSAIRSASPFALPADSYAYWKDYPVRLRKQRGN